MQGAKSFTSYHETRMYCITNYCPCKIKKRVFRLCNIGLRQRQFYNSIKSVSVSIGRERIRLAAARSRAPPIDKINNRCNRYSRRRREIGCPSPRNTRRGCRSAACKPANDRTRQVTRKRCDCKPPNARLSLGPLPAYLLRDPENKKGQ